MPELYLPCNFKYFILPALATQTFELSLLKNTLIASCAHIGNKITICPLWEIVLHKILHKKSHKPSKIQSKKTMFADYIFKKIRF